MSELFSLASGTNHNVCQYCDYNHKSECPCCTSLGFEGFSLDEHDKQIRADAIDEVFKILEEEIDIIDGASWSRLQDRLVKMKEQSNDQR